MDGKRLRQGNWKEKLLRRHRLRGRYKLPLINRQRQVMQKKKEKEKTDPDWWELLLRKIGWETEGKVTRLRNRRQSICMRSRRLSIKKKKETAGKLESREMKEADRGTAGYWGQRGWSTNLQTKWLPGSRGDCSMDLVMAPETTRGTHGSTGAISWYPWKMTSQDTTVRVCGYIRLPGCFATGLPSCIGMETISGIWHKGLRDQGDGMTAIM